MGVGLPEFQTPSGQCAFDTPLTPTDAERMTGGVPADFALIDREPIVDSRSRLDSSP